MYVLDPFTWGHLYSFESNVTQIGQELKNLMLKQRDIHTESCMYVHRLFGLFCVEN